jgi:hypothetical protein
MLNFFNRDDFLMFAMLKLTGTASCKFLLNLWIFARSRAILLLWVRGNMASSYGASIQMVRFRY